MEYENYLNENILQNDTKIKKKKKLKKKLKNFENKNDIEIYDFISASFYLRNKKVLSPFSKFSLVDRSLFKDASIVSERSRSFCWSRHEHRREKIVTSRSRKWRKERDRIDELFACQ